jgi:hypothetical protein
MRAAPFIQWGCGGRERTNERGRIPPSSSPCPSSSPSPCVPPPTPPHSLRFSPRRLLTALACQCGTGAYSSKAGGVGVQVGCRWFWGFDGVRDIEGGCAVVFDGVWGVDGGWGAVFDGVRGVEGGWSADLGAVGLLGVGSGVSTAFAWRFDGFCMLTCHGCGWRRGGSFASISRLSTRMGR